MIPFLPVLELMRDFFEITEHDGDEAARRKIAGTLLLLDQASSVPAASIFKWSRTTLPCSRLRVLDRGARRRAPGSRRTSATPLP